MGAPCRQRCVFEQNVRTGGQLVEVCDVECALAKPDIAELVGTGAQEEAPAFGFAGAMG